MLLAIGLWFGYGEISLAGLCLFYVGRSGAFVIAGVSMTTLELRPIVACVGISFGFQAVLGLASLIAPDVICATAAVIGSLLGCLLVCSKGSYAFGRISSMEAPRDLAVTRPMSFLSPFSGLFVCIFLFHLAFGYALRFDGSISPPIGEYLSAAAIVIVAAIVMTVRSFPADRLFEWSALGVVAGFLCAASGQDGFSVLAVPMLHIGSVLFDMTAWLALVSIGARNPLTAVTTISWGRGICALGTVLGAQMGALSHDVIGREPSLVFMVSGVLLLVFCAYVIVGLKSFTFAGVISGVEPVSLEAAGEGPTALEAARTPEEAFASRCEAIASEFSLTPREAEVFAMLARGRDRAYIEEALVVSRNTVKAHVKHVYAKLGIHSHQELLDLVEG